MVTEDTSVGRKLTFNGKSKIVLGDGTGKTKLNFNSAATGSTLTFLVGSSTEDPGFDVNNRFNWVDNDNVIALSPPCKDDVAIFDVDHKYKTGQAPPYKSIFASSYNRPFYASVVSVGGYQGGKPNRREQTKTVNSKNCTNEMEDSAADIFSKQSATFKVVLDLEIGGTSCLIKDPSISVCSAQSLKASEQGFKVLKAPINCASPEIGTWVDMPVGYVKSVGDSVIDTDGEVVDNWGTPNWITQNSLVKVTDSKNEELYSLTYNKDRKITKITKDGKALCKLGEEGFDAAGKAALDAAVKKECDDTLASQKEACEKQAQEDFQNKNPDFVIPVPPQATRGEDKGSDVPVIAGAAAGAVVVIIAAIFYMKGRKNSGGHDDTRNVVSFENPLYDSATGKPVGGRGPGTESAYADVASTAGGNSAYMDVPSGYTASEQNFGGFDEPAYDSTTGSGYMDVNASGGSGYMDVTMGGGSGYTDVNPDSGPGYMDVNAGDDDFDEEDV